MNRDELPIAWVAHANGQLLGTAALRVHDLEGREDLTPWLGGVFVDSEFRGRGIGGGTVRRCRGRGSRARDTDSLFVHARQACVVLTPGLDNAWPVCVARPIR
jgi:GNAT superfamily N-acetyltransferase